MAERVPITVALYGFAEEHAPSMRSAFANTDKWPTPWRLTETIEDARVVIVSLASEDDFEEVEKLKQDLPKAEIVVFSSKKPPYTKWHLARQANGKASIVGFSQLVLKISHSLSKNLKENPQSLAEAISTEVKTDIKTPAELASSTDAEDFEQEPEDLGSFFNQLDSLLDTKPNEKRKRFNESK